MAMFTMTLGDPLPPRHRDRPKIDFTFSAENENETGSKQIKQQHIIMKFSI